PTGTEGVLLANVLAGNLTPTGPHIPLFRSLCSDFSYINFQLDHPPALLLHRPQFWTANQPHCEKEWTRNYWHGLSAPPQPESRSLNSRTQFRYDQYKAAGPPSNLGHRHQ
ncbi:MAG TPA: hypothetical protein VN638_05555, partial [Nitrospiraceae bacterium]|nr:hypothetical protein [Nitrospiraceae bacterium]